MMSKKSGPAYGFKLSSLYSLKITKSTDKKRNLLHYIVDLVKEDYPDLSNFHTELRKIEQAAGYALDQIGMEVNDLAKGMRDTKAQLDFVEGCLAAAEDRKTGPQPSTGGSLADKQAQRDRLKAFYVGRCEGTVNKIRADFEQGKLLYKECFEYFGEKKDPGLSTFFGYFITFVSDWKTAQREIEAFRRKAEAEAIQLRAKEESDRRNVDKRKVLLCLT